MGVHLVFFLHVTTGPDHVNNVMALAFGVLIVLLILAGSLWIMANLNHNLAPIEQYMQTQREPGPVVRTVTTRGVVGPSATTPVGARVSGVVQALSCDANMQVKAGQICAKIDPRPYQIAVDKSRAELAAAEFGSKRPKRISRGRKRPLKARRPRRNVPLLPEKRLTSRARTMRGRRRRQNATKQESRSPNSTSCR